MRALSFFITVILFTHSYGRLPTHASRREFGVTDTERSTAVAIESALRPFARAHVALTLLSSDGIWPPHPPPQPPPLPQPQPPNHPNHLSYMT